MRTILHSDLNNFFASVECLYEPSLAKRPMAVAGDPEARHGIVLAKNQLAKRFNVKTGEALWEARKKCPDILFVPPHFERYEKYSKLARELYIEYTDRVESFGMDECWLDVSGVIPQYGSGRAIADRIRESMKAKLGLTVSVGVSFNKVFAKLGSDMRKPDATTVISEENYRELVWRLPVSELLFVGRATEKKLAAVGIHTIGELAGCDADFLYSYLGKNGLTLHRFANGRDDSDVNKYFAAPAVKSVSNGTTPPRDLVTEDDVKIVLTYLCEKVAARLREQRCVCSVVHLQVRDCELVSYTRQLRLSEPASGGRALYAAAVEMFYVNRFLQKPVRSLSVGASGLSFAGDAVQTSLFEEEIRAQKLSSLDAAMDRLNGKFGKQAVTRGIILKEPELVTRAMPSSFGFIFDGS